MRTQTKYGVCRSELLDEVKKRNWFWFARKERCVIIESKIISCISNLNAETYVKVYSEHKPMAIPTARTLLEGRASVVVCTEQACATNFFLSFLLNKKNPPISLPNFKKISFGQAFVGNQHCTALQNMRSEARERRHPSCQKLTVDSRM